MAGKMNGRCASISSGVATARRFRFDNMNTPSAFSTDSEYFRLGEKTKVVLGLAAARALRRFRVLRLLLAAGALMVQKSDCEHGK